MMRKSENLKLLSNATINQADQQTSLDEAGAANAFHHKPGVDKMTYN